MNNCKNCDNCSTAVLSIPPELFEEAGIPLGADIEITCGNGEIVIRTAEDDILSTVPPDLMNLFISLGISMETVRAVWEEMYDEQ